MVIKTVTKISLEFWGTQNNLEIYSEYFLIVREEGNSSMVPL
jgi:hypothetical protein